MAHRLSIKSKIIPILGILLLTLVSFSPSLNALWTSDDYVLVSGIFNPSKSFFECLSRTKSGIFTPHRFFTYSFINEGGVLGPGGAHLTLLVLHLVTVALFAALVSRISKSRFITLTAAALFSVAPWVSQPVIWWSAGCTIESTIFILIAANLFYTAVARRDQGDHFWTLLASAIFAFISLCFYDLWIPGFLLFAGLWYLAMENDHSHYWLERKCLLQLSTIAAPFLLWLTLVAIIGPYNGAQSRLHLSLDRIPISLLSIHLRIIHWWITPEWLALWMMGTSTLVSSLLVGLAFCFGLGFLWYSLSQCVLVHEQIVRTPNARRNAFPLRLLIFCWLMFLASRLSLVLMGGTSIVSRVSYGAGMAVALAIAVLAEWASPIFLKRNTYWGQVYCALFSTIIALMALASIGLSEQMSASTQAEAHTVQFLEEELHKDPSIKSFLVIGTPVPDIGESNYFIENKGEYLQYALNKKGYNVEAQVTRTETFANAKSHRTYIWSGDQWPAAILSLRHPIDSHD